MSAVKRMIMTLLATPLGACWTGLGPRIPVGHHFEYTLSGDATMLVQAFDDGSTTYVQLDPDTADPIEITAPPAGTPVAYTTQPHYLVVPGVYAELRVRVGDHVADVAHNLRSAVGTASAVAASKNVDGTPLSPAPVVTVATTDSEDTAAIGVLEHDIARLEAHVAALSAEIDAFQSAGVSTRLRIERPGSTPRLAVEFADHSNRIELDEHLTRMLGDTATAAEHVVLHGHTDAAVKSVGAAHLALERAIAVRTLLLALHVQPERIKTYYRGAGDFIADNGTPDGKAKNRRVDIELRTW